MALFFVHLQVIEEAVSKAYHPVLDTGSPEKLALIIKRPADQARNNIRDEKTFETAPFSNFIYKLSSNNVCLQACFQLTVR